MASSVDARRVIKNAPFRVHWCIRSTATSNPLTGGLAGLAAQLSGDGGSFAASTNTPAEIGTTGYGTLDLTVAEMSYDTVRAEVQATTANKIYDLWTLTPEAALDSGVAQAVASTTVTLRSGASATTDFYKGGMVEIVRGTGAGQARQVTAYNGTTKVATVDRAWATNPDATSVYVLKADGAKDVAMTGGNATGGANLAAFFLGAFVTGNVNDAGPTSGGFAGNSGLSSTDSFYSSLVLTFTSGTLKGIGRKVTGYTGSTRTFAFSTAFPSAPANGDTFIILGLQK